MIPMRDDSALPPDEQPTAPEPTGEITADSAASAADAAPQAAPALVTFSQRMRRWLGLDGAEHQQRLDALSASIQARPHAAVNYLLRGELHLDAGRYEAAFQDFTQALRYADAQLEQSDWGVVAQTLRDRALVGLRRSRSRIQSLEPPPDDGS
jgi:tetratricopeptide (TPR) repeat protein